MLLQGELLPVWWSIFSLCCWTLCSSYNLGDTLWFCYSVLDFLLLITRWSRIITHLFHLLLLLLCPCVCIQGRGSLSLVVYLFWFVLNCYKIALVIPDKFITTGSSRWRILLVCHPAEYSFVLLMETWLITTYTLFKIKFLLLHDWWALQVLNSFMCVQVS